MFRRSQQCRNVYDPLFMRQIKDTWRKYQEAMDHSNRQPISRVQSVDIDELGPSWSLGAMNVAKRKMQVKAKSADFVVEVRDARLPFTTANKSLMKMTKDKPRLIVFNKAELSNEDANAHIQQFYEMQGIYCMFTGGTRAWRETVDTIQRFVMNVLPEQKFKTTPHVGMVMGMPNVGKSTLINSLRLAHEVQFSRGDMRRPRRGQAVTVDPMNTKSVENVPVSRDPPILLCDTPGMTLVGNFSKESGFKLAACNVIPTDDISLTHEIVAAYLYDVLVAGGASEHIAECLHLPRAATSFPDLVALMAHKGGNSFRTPMRLPHKCIVAKSFINDFSRGRLGRVTLDRLPKLPVGADAQIPDPRAAAASSRKSGEADDDELDDEVLHAAYTHHVEAKDSNIHYPEEMREVLTKIHEGNETISRQRGPISTEAAMHHKQHTALRRKAWIVRQ